ncbi:hypothetical protein [Lentzea sp. NPDC059081]|uniref:hypothetical protein n=1 Tax=Lentzea sp. NPDC059081 TaxID=3346719 RepID=UPI0036BB2375
MIQVRSAVQGPQDAAEQSIRDNAESTLAQLRQHAEDGVLTDADIAEATGAQQSVRAVTRTDGEIAVTSRLIGVSSGLFGPAGSDQCVVFTLKQPLGPGAEASYRDEPSCPEATFSPTARPVQS